MEYSHTTFWKSISKVTLFSADQSVVIPDTVRAFPLYSAAVIDPWAAMVENRV